MKNNGILIEHSYDPDADALFISKVDNYEYDESVELTNDVILDFDMNGEASALEILNASKVFNVSKYSLGNIGPISMKIGVNKKVICLKLGIGVLVHNKELLKSLNHSAINDIDAPAMQTELATA
ncbi:MAG: DUF2283 domain-containing protein [Methanobacteriaceae archaeon]